MAAVPPPGSPGTGTEPTGTAFAKALFQYVGRTPYVYGGNSLTTGTDCSGLVVLELQKLGITAPRTSEEQYSWARPIGQKDLQPGDLVFMNFPGEVSPGHVEVYVGGGQVLGADDPSVGVAVSPLSGVAGNIVGYGRVPGLNYQGESLSAGPVATVAPGKGVTAPSGGSNLWAWVSSLYDGLFGTVPNALGNAFGSGVSDVAGGITGLAAPFISIAEHIDFLFQPSHWLRIMAGIGGGIAVIGGVAMLASQGKQIPVTGPGGIGTTVGTPSAALPVGMLVTGFGFLLLYIAFHNLPSSVTNWSSMLGYLDDQIHKTDATTAGRVAS